MSACRRAALCRLASHTAALASSGAVADVTVTPDPLYALDASTSLMAVAGSRGTVSLVDPRTWRVVER